MRTLAILTAAAVMTGCASSSGGTYVTEEQFRSTIIGETTKSDIIAEFGEPNLSAIGTLPEGGVEMIGYQAYKASEDAKSYIPIIGAFIGESSGEDTSVQFAFDENGTLTWRNYTQNKLKSGNALLDAVMGD